MKWRDLDLDLFLESVLDEDLEGQKANRGEFIKNKYGPLFKGLHGFGPNEFDKFLDKLGEVDPTPNGIYMPWIARLVLTKPNENRAEDLDRVRQDLQAFEKFKRKIERKDINQYKSFADLYDAIAPFLEPREPTEDEKAKADAAAELEKTRSDIIHVYEGPEGWIRIPTTQAAAMLLGKGTRWCTAAHTNNRFEYYNETDHLFVIYDKEQGKKYQEWQAKRKEFLADPANEGKKPPGPPTQPKGLFQLHIQSRQFTSDDDRNLGIDAVPQWARKHIADYYMEHNPQLTRTQVLHLKNFTDKNIAKGSVHEPLLGLYTRFKVK